MKHDEFLERMEKAVKLAGQALIDNADKLVAKKVDENLGVNSVVISITLPTLTDSWDGPTIEVSTTYIPRDAVMVLAGIDEGEF